MIAYTHKPVLDREHPGAASNRRFIAEAIEGGLMLNLSGNNPSHADALAALDLAPIVTILSQRLRAPTQIARARQKGMDGDDWRIPRSHLDLADTYAGRTTHRGMPGELHRNDLRSMWLLCSASQADYRLPNAHWLACRRKGHRCPRRATRGAVDLP